MESKTTVGTKEVVYKVKVFDAMFNLMSEATFDYRGNAIDFAKANADTFIFAPLVSSKENIAIIESIDLTGLDRDSVGINIF